MNALEEDVEESDTAQGKKGASKEAFLQKLKAMRTISGKKLQEEEAKTTRELTKKRKMMEKLRRETIANANEEVSEKRQRKLDEQRTILKDRGGVGADRE